MNVGPTGPQGPAGADGTNGTNGVGTYDFVTASGVSMSAGFTTLYYTVPTDGTYILQLQGTINMLVAGTVSSRLMLGAVYQVANINNIQVTDCGIQQLTFTHTSKIIATTGAPTIGFKIESSDITATLNNASLTVIKIA